MVAAHAGVRPCSYCMFHAFSNASTCPVCFSHKGGPPPAQERALLVVNDRVCHIQHKPTEPRVRSETVRDAGVQSNPSLSGFLYATRMIAEGINGILTSTTPMASTTLCIQFVYVFVSHNQHS